MKNRKQKLVLLFLSVILIPGLFLLKSDTVLGQYADDIDAEIESLNEEFKIKITIRKCSKKKKKI
jgi:hypothetical protein